MVDIASIVIAVISGVVALVAAGITTFFTWFSDERKRLSEAEKLVGKYRDPLLLASQDLQSRLYNIVDHGFTRMFFHKKEVRKDDLLLYTTFLVGQYLSWTYILRRQAQFLAFSTDKQNLALTKVLSAIAFEFSTHKHNKEDKKNHGWTLQLWRGQQMAIGELMTVKEGDQLYCMGYAAFLRRWRGDGRGRTEGGGSGVVTGAHSASSTDGKPEGAGSQVGHDDATAKQDHHDEKDDSSEEFRRWLHSIPDDIGHISKAAGRHEKVPDQRLRRLQHLLLDLIQVLDDKSLRSEAKFTSPCHRAEFCDCTKCAGKPPEVCPCTDLTECPWKPKMSKAPDGPEQV